MSMIKSLVPAKQTFKQLASQQFFLLGEDKEDLFMKILPEGKYNAIQLEHNDSNHGHSHNYYFKLVAIPDIAEVRHVTVAYIEIRIMPNIDLENK